MCPQTFSTLKRDVVKRCQVSGGVTQSVENVQAALPWGDLVPFVAQGVSAMSAARISVLESMQVRAAVFVAWITALGVPKYCTLSSAS
jgi:hypothetical protein